MATCEKHGVELDAVGMCADCSFERGAAFGEAAHEATRSVLLSYIGPQEEAPLLSEIRLDDVKKQ